MKKTLVPILLAYLFFMLGCVYIVLPEDLGNSQATQSQGWKAIVTSIEKSESGDLHINLAIRNDTGDWSAMQAASGKAAILTSDGKPTNCDTVLVGTGGHRLAPGFQMRGYIAGTKTEPVTQLIYVDCKGAQPAPGATLSIDYSYVTGPYNYYEPDNNQVNGRLQINLDEVAQDLKYPVAEEVDDLIQASEAEIIALNKVVLTLANVERTSGGLQFTWHTTNPGEYPTYVHVGNPPVIGEDGILYGFYETPDIVSVPITPAGDKAEWTTEVAVPQDAQGLYILLSVESGKARLFANYAIDITDR